MKKITMNELAMLAYCNPQLKAQIAQTFTFKADGGGCYNLDTILAAHGLILDNSDLNFSTAQRK